MANKNTMYGPLDASYTYNRSSGMFIPIAYEGGTIAYDGSDIGNYNLPKEVRGKVKRITHTFTKIQGDLSIMMLHWHKSGELINNLPLVHYANSQQISGNNYKAVFEGSWIEGYLNNLIEANPAGSAGMNNLVLEIMPSKYSNANTFKDSYLLIEYDFAYPIHHDVLEGDPNAGNVRLKVMYDGLQDEEDRPGRALNRVRYESTLSFSGHPQIVKNGTGRIIEYSPSEIKASQGTLNIKLYRVAHNSDLNQSIDSLIGTINKSITFTATPPVISALEPENIDVNVTQAYPITWTVDRQDSFKLTVNGQVFSGTTARQVLVPANTLKKGLNTITLQSTLGIATATKTVTFRGYGRPNNPVIAEREIYNTSLPTITWATDEQNIYHIQIKQGSATIIDSGEIISSMQRYKVTTPLQNETNYTIRLRVKNAQGLYSDWMEKTILISYHRLDPPELSLYETSGDLVTVNAINPEDSRFDHCEVLKRSEYTDWQKIAVNGPLNVSFADFQLAGGETYFYKVIAYDRAGGAVESEIKSISIKLKHSSFLDLDTMQELTGSFSNSDAGLTVQRVQDKQILKYEGLRAPVTEKGETDYSVLNFNAIFRNPGEYRKFVNDAENAIVVLYRDAHGHYYYCQLTAWGDEVTHPGGVVRHPFVFTEVNFLEGIIYDGGGSMQIIKLDQGYKLDRGYVLDGIYYPPN